MCVPALAAEDVVIPVKAHLNGKHYGGELRAQSDGAFPVVAWGDERHPLQEEFLPPKVVLALRDMTASGTDFIRSVPYELTDAYVNGLLNEVHLDLEKSPLNGLTVSHLRLIFKFSYRPPLFPSLQRGEISLGLDGFRDAFPAMGPHRVVAFGDNLLPVIVLGRGKSLSYDGHGNRVIDSTGKHAEEWRARVILAHQAENMGLLPVLDLSSASIMSVTEEVYKQSLERVRKQGLDAAEKEGIELHRLKDVYVPADQRNPEGIKGIADLETKAMKLDLRALEAKLAERTWRVEAAAKAAEGGSSVIGDYVRDWLGAADEDRAKELWSLIEGMKPFVTEDLKELFKVLQEKKHPADDRRALVEIVKLATSVEESFKDSVISALLNNRTRDAAEALLKKFPPESSENLLALARLLTHNDAAVKRAVSNVFAQVPPANGPRADLAAFHTELVRVLSVDADLKSTREAAALLIRTKATGAVIQQLVVLLYSNNWRTRASAAEVLKEVGPGGSGVSMALVDALADPHARPHAKKLLLALAPHTKETQLALIRLLQGPDEKVGREAASLLRELPADDDLLTNDVVALMRRCQKPR